MSRKRQATGDQLTGGTKDVNPQYLNGRVTLSAANTATSATLGTPIVRVGSSSGGGCGPCGKSVIMEILKVFVQMPEIDADAAAATSRSLGIIFSTTDFGTTQAAFDNPRVFAMMVHSVRNAFTAAGTGLLDVQDDPQVWDCTDDAGHGILVATDNIFAQGFSSGQAAAVSFPFKILYRFKEVSLVEYIGIVQSQQ